MREPASRGPVARRPACLTVAFLCAAVAAQEQPTSQPASRPVVVETFAAARQRLARAQPQDRARADIALLAALDFALALTSADGARAASLLDVTGYHSLPFDDELPERPEKPTLPAAFEKQVSARPKFDLGYLPMDRIEVMSQETVRAVFPAVATWMLPQDFAVVFHPVVRGAAPGWVDRDGCLVIRLRSDKPAVLGGNLLRALPATPAASPGP